MLFQRNFHSKKKVPILHGSPMELSEIASIENDKNINRVKSKPSTSRLNSHRTLLVVARLFCCLLFILLTLNLWYRPRRNLLNDRYNEATYYKINNLTESAALLTHNKQQKQGKHILPVQRHNPTNHACDGFKGIYHIEKGDIGGAAGTIFFQFVIGQIIWAEKYNFKPWVYLNNVSHIVYDSSVHGKNSSFVDFTMLKGMDISYIERPMGHRRNAYQLPYIDVPSNTSVSFRSALKSLCFGTYKLVSKTPDTGNYIIDVRRTDRFSANTEFFSEETSICIPLDEYPRDGRGSVEFDIYIDARIVRIMKAHRRLEHRLLIQHVKQLPGFIDAVCDLRFIEERIREMIERKYIEICPNPQHYNNKEIVYDVS